MAAQLLPELGFQPRLPGIAVLQEEPSHGADTAWVPLSPLPAACSVSMMPSVSSSYVMWTLVFHLERDCLLHSFPAHPPSTCLHLSPVLHRLSTLLGQHILCSAVWSIPEAPFPEFRHLK